MKFLVLVIRIIFLPFLFVTVLVYPELKLKRTVVSYTWYNSKKEFDKIIESCTDAYEFQKTYGQWKSDAQITIDDFSKSGVLYFKVIMRPKELFKWLHKNGLENCSENREKYAAAVMDKIKTYGVEQKI